MVYALVFIFGTIVGSFLNVVILRYNTGESFLTGDSRCFKCGKNLKWHELVPVLSFVFQKRKCAECKTKISWQYPIVEILTGLIFALFFYFSYQGNGEFLNYSSLSHLYGGLPMRQLLSTFYFLIIFCLLIIISVYDFRHQIIPNFFVWIFNILAFINLFFIKPVPIPNTSVFYPLLSTLYSPFCNFFSGLAFAGVFALMWFVSKGKWMGFGDAKLVLGMGWILGLVKGFAAIVFSFWIGAVVGIVLLFAQKKRYNIKSKIAFGPFLTAGFFISYFLGDYLINLIL